MSQSSKMEEKTGSAAILPDSAQEDFLRDIVDRFPEPAFVVDEAGAIQVWNEGMIEFTGYARDEVLGRIAYDVFQTDGETKTLAEKVLERGEPIRESQVRSAIGKDGDVFHTQAKGLPFTDDDGAVVGAVEILSRVTELVEARQRVNDIQRQFSETVETSIAELDTAAEDVATAATTMSSDLDEQVESLGEVSGEVSTFSATVEEIASSAEEVSSQSNHARETAMESEERGETVRERMDAVSDTVGSLAEETADVEAEIEDIDTIVESINAIADQTNLLALNANIEAARADQAGDGFAVVANEIKDLAEQS
ncbi:MAG: methyl-accepting chemotaxis protein, partial [Halodesulfurarchaeum sp.]